MTPSCPSKNNLRIVTNANSPAIKYNAIEGIDGKFANRFAVIFGVFLIANLTSFEAKIGAIIIM
ncbi:hypothetical protein JD969_01460 [Planctomycetota bacterium]|nr:hypothetical protein JD969_01460 [Planctomycetota bacterium]